METDVGVSESSVADLEVGNDDVGWKRSRFRQIGFDAC